MAIYLHDGDLPKTVKLGKVIAVDTETMGLNPHRDRLCLVQLSAGDGEAHLVRLPKGKYLAPNLKKILAIQKTLKIFHFARFDLAVIKKYLDVDATPVYCTKIASKLTSNSRIQDADAPSSLAASLTIRFSTSSVSWAAASSLETR